MVCDATAGAFGASRGGRQKLSWFRSLSRWGLEDLTLRVLVCWCQRPQLQATGATVQHLHPCVPLKAFPGDFVGTPPLALARCERALIYKHSSNHLSLKDDISL